MILIKCENAVLRILNDGTRRIVCKNTKGICIHQKYCAELKRNVLTPNASKCVHNIHDTNLVVAQAQNVKCKKNKFKKNDIEKIPTFSSEITNIEVVKTGVDIFGVENNDIVKDEILEDKKELVENDENIDME